MLPPPLENNPFLCSSEGRQYGPTYCGYGCGLGCSLRYTSRVTNRSSRRGIHRISALQTAVPSEKTAGGTGSEHILPVSCAIAVGAGVAIPPVHG
jgi:hypothetical protein